MYFLTDKKGVLINNVFIPELWGQTDFEGIEEELLYAIYPTKQLAYMAKHFNRLDDHAILPVDEYLKRIIDADEKFILDAFAHYRFAFVVGFKNNFETTAFYRKFVNYKELTSGHNWLGQIIKDIPLLGEALNYESNKTDEELAILAKKLIEQTLSKGDKNKNKKWWSRVMGVFKK